MNRYYKKKNKQQGKIKMVIFLNVFIILVINVEHIDRILFGVCISSKDTICMA